MAAKDPELRRQIGRYGQAVRWGGVVDRSQETAAARAAGTGTVDYWLRKLDAEKFATASDEQRLAAAESLRRAHFLRMSLASAKARKRTA